VSQWSPSLLLLASGCIFITQADIDARQAGLNGSATDVSGDDDDILGDDDDDDLGDADLIPGDWREVSVGAWISCAIEKPYSLRCWGHYDDPDDWFPAVPDDLDFVGVSVGVEIGCAWDDSGDVRCFGAPGGDAYEPERLVMADPGMQVDGEVQCGTRECCAVSNGELVCWDDALLEPADFPSLDTTGGVESVSGWGGWCLLDNEGDIDCFGTSGVGDGEPDEAGPYDEVHRGTNGWACGVRDQDIACWNSGMSRSSMADIVAPDRSELTDLHVIGDSNLASVCGLRGGEVECFQFESQSGYDTEAPSGSWTKLSLFGNDGCVIDANGRMACFGELGSMPTP